MPQSGQTTELEALRRRVAALEEENNLLREHDRRFDGASGGKVLEGFVADTTEYRQANEMLEQKARELTRINARLLALGRLSAQIQLTFDLDLLFETLGGEFKALGFTCVVSLLESDSDRLLIRYHNIDSAGLNLAEKLAGMTLHGVLMPLDKWPTSIVYGEKKPVFVPETFQVANPLLPGIPDKLIQSVISAIGMNPSAALMALPLLVGDQFIGTLSLWGEGLREEDIPLFTAFAGQIAVTIQNARLYQALEDYSERLEEDVRQRTSELRQLKDRVETILNSVGEALMVVSLDGRIQQVNPAFETHTGYSAVEVELEYHHELLLDVSMPTEVFKESTAAMRAGQIWRGEMPVRRKDGSIYEAAVTIVPMHDDDGKIKAFVGSLRDISALKELERMKDALVSTTIHELRTPLTSIRGFSEILLTRELDEERHRKYLEMINQKSEQLNNIIDDMLDLARLESGKMLESRPEPTNLDELIQEVLVPYDEMAPDHHFQTRGLEDLPPVQVDPFRITQVLRNLLSNAVKYSPEGGNIVIRGRVENDMAAISVEDEGLGMTREQQAHLFERFYRAHTSMNISGTGLGLTICKFIVEQHGGRIWVESRPNVGSTFTFTLPLDSSQTALEE